MFFFVIPFFYSGVHYEKTTKAKIKTIEKFLKKQKKKELNIVDLGSGNADVLIDLGKELKQKTHLTGFEINPILVGQSKYKIKKHKLSHLIDIEQKNFWKKRLTRFNVIIIFQFGTYMQKLEDKIKRECHKGTIIISNHWKLPNMIPEKVENDIYFYKL